MKAAFLDTTGSPDVIQYGDLPAPVPQSGEVLVKVSAAALNPVDTYIRSGAIAMPLPKPFIPGCDLAGTVAAVGPDTKRFKVGDRVWGSNQGLLGRQGTFAEYAAVHEDWLYPTPENVKDEDAAANALVGITAWLGLVWRAPLQAGERVFVNGGTGGVGAMVVQMAKALGARVLATVGSEEKAKLAASLGATTLNYMTDDIVKKVKDFTNQRGLDLWYETQPPADFERTCECMSRGGRIIVMAGRGAKPVFPNAAFYPKNLQLFGFAMFNVEAATQRRAADDMNRWMSEGKLKSLIGVRYPLAKSAEAHRLQEENTIGKKGTLTGKIVITI